MRAPLALGILTWDDVLAGFSAPEVRLGASKCRLDNLLEMHRRAENIRGIAGTRADTSRGESHPCAERIFYDSTDV